MKILNCIALVGACVSLMSSMPALAAPITGPTWVVDAPGVLVVTFSGDAITTDNDLELGPLNSPSGLWHIPTLHIVEHNGATDTLTVSGELLFPSGNPFAFSFSFDGADGSGRQSASDSDRCEVCGAAVEVRTDDDGQILGYGIGMGARPANCPDGGTTGILFASGVCGLLIARRIR